MEIKFLKAGTGDCIIIHHNTFNVVIDGGDDEKYLLDEVRQIKERGEIIDLLIITHHDDDHIKGIIALLDYVDKNEFAKDKSFVNKVIFNSPRSILGKIPAGDSQHLSYRQAYDVEERLIKMKADWRSIYTDESESIEHEGLLIEFLSPTKEILEQYSNQSGAYLSSDHRCDWGTAMGKLDKFIDDNSRDDSISNRASIVLKVSYTGKNILLASDVTPDRFEQIINKLFIANGNAPAVFDYVKLPHHGSYRNITANILNKINCCNYIISTNGRKHYLPNKRTLLKILKFSHREKSIPINFFFNYDEVRSYLKISEKEMRDYNFKLIPNTNIYGFSIRES